MKKSLFVLALALIAPLSVAQAEDPVSKNTCLLTDVSTYTFVTGPEKCWGSYEGNNNQATEDFIFGFLGSEYADPEDWTAGDNIGTEGAGSTGSFAFSTPQKGIFAVALKAGSGNGGFENSGWSIYLFNTGENLVNGITYNTRAMGNTDGRSPGLSHWTLYSFGGGDTECVETDPTGCCLRNPTAPGCTTVPEPSSYALMFAGLAALGVVARRRRNNA